MIGGGNVAYDVARSGRCGRSPTTRRARPRASRGRAACTSSRSRGSRRCRPTPSRSVEGDEEGIERLNGWGPVEIERDAAGAVTGVTFRRCLRVYDENRRFSPVYDDAIRQTVAVRHRPPRRRAGAEPLLPRRRREGHRADPPRLAEGRSGDARDDGARRLRRGRPRARHAAADRRGRVRQGRGALGLPHAHGPRARGRHAHRPPHASPATGASAGYESIRRVAGAGRASRRNGWSIPRPRSRLGYTAEQAMREASRCLDCGVTPVFDGTRCVLCGGCVDVCPTLCLKLVALADLEPSADSRAAIDRDLGPRRRIGRELRDPQGRGPVHPLRALRDALPDRRDHDGTRHLRTTTWRTA